MMQGLWISLAQINPGLHDFEDKYVVLFHELPVSDATLEIGKALLQQRSRHELCRPRRQAERVNFIDVASRAVADFYDR